MYDLHCHSLLSDGVLLPSEVAARYFAAGYKTIAITDHADYSNIDIVTDAILCFTRHWPKDAKIKVLPGVELTHLPLSQFKPLAKYARKKGLKVIIGHGETISEPVVKGTNRACLEADIDILAHPGLISKEDVEFAKKRGIFLEITSRSGHRDTNPHVAELALKVGARLILVNDSHMPEDILPAQELRNFGLKAGLSEADIDNIYKSIATYMKF
ncbi:MAG: hypothetical protein AMJ95_12090 [Omnitrophica WOR_2 bacterium SM23_72]|nr:MAG: hypothetical protein AMJ95_12090 [Omnitrophica WOR_2 bacterium SM23_72]